ncbi:MAG: hypothetical protein WC548_01945 [Candidatus Pacearchaeota archaeon]
MKEKSLCISCFEPITNPICEWCYLKQISRWFEYKGLNDIKKNLIISNLKKAFSKEISADDTCVLCQKEEVKICSYCFFVKIVKVMKKIKLSNELIQSFLADFNYHVGREEEFMSLIK